MNLEKHRDEIDDVVFRILFYNFILFLKTEENLILYIYYDKSEIWH